MLIKITICKQRTLLNWEENDKPLNRKMGKYNEKSIHRRVRTKRLTSTQGNAKSSKSEGII